MIKEKVKVKILCIDFENSKKWRVFHNEDEYGRTEIKDGRFWRDVQEGYYRFTKGTTLIADINCPWDINKPLEILKVYEVLYVN